MTDKNLRLQVMLNGVDKMTGPLTSAQASTKRLATEMKSSREALTRLKQASEKLSSLNGLSKTVKHTGSELEQARLKAKMMTLELSGMTAPTKKHTQAVEAQWRAVSQLESKQQQALSKIKDTRTALSQLGISAQDNAKATAQISQETAQYNQRLSEQETRLKRVGDVQRRRAAAQKGYEKTLATRDKVVGAGLASTAAGLSIAAPVWSAVKSYAALEDAMKGVAKQVEGLRDAKGQRTARYVELQNTIRKLSETLPLENGATDIAALIEGAGRMGVAKAGDPWEKQKRDLLSFATVAAKASKAFALPTEKLSEDLGKIATLYNIPINQLEALGDTLNYLDDNTLSKGADIIDVMQRLGEASDKLDYKQAAALGSTFLSLGAAPEIAASASKAMLRELGIASMQGARFMKGLEGLGLDAAQLEKGIANNAVGTIEKVLSQIKTLTKEKQLVAMTQLFGKEFGDDAQKLGLNLDEFLRQLALTKAAGAKGSMQREADIDADSLSAQYLLLRSGVKNVFSSLGETMRQPLLEIIEVAKKVTGAFRQWTEAHPLWVGALMKVAAGLGALLIAAGALAIAFAALIGPFAVIRLGAVLLGIKLASLSALFIQLVGPVRILGASLLWLGRLAWANPIIAAISLIAGGALLIAQHWDSLGPRFQAIWQGIQSGASLAWRSIQESARNAFNGLINDLMALPAKFTTAGRAMIDGLLGGLTDKWALVKNKFSAIAEYLPKMSGKSSLSPSGLGFAGEFDRGGRIPRGQFGLVGETGPELVSGPAQVTGRRKTAELASSSWTNGVATPARRSRSTPPRHPASITINIHPHPSHSSADIAREVARSLSERERQQQARERSQFYDQEAFS